MLDDSWDFMLLFKEICDDKVFIIIIDVNVFIFYFIFCKVLELGMILVFYKYIFIIMDFFILYLDGIVEDFFNILGFFMFNIFYFFYFEFVCSFNMFWRENCEVSIYLGFVLLVVLMFDVVYVVVSVV